MKKPYQFLQKFICIVALNAFFTVQAQMYEFLQENRPIIMFQPSDGSLENGTYSPITQQALTTNGSYNSITIIPKTSSGPTLTDLGMFKNEQNEEFYPVGTFAYFSEKLGDTTFYCIFGKKINDTLTFNEEAS
jgi:hypothetical protein